MGLDGETDLTATGAGPVLCGRALRRRYSSGGRTVDAVAGVDLSVAAGELVVVTGPSGSGKTTLLHLLAAIATPDDGDVLVEGRSVLGLGRGERADLRLARLGLVFSEHNLSPALSAAENVDLPLALRGLGRAEREQRVHAALDRLGVGALADRLPDALSSGEQQRVAVARAIAGSPAALVADEPTAHLDSAAARSLLDVLAELVAEQSVAALVATHDPLLLQGATRVVRLVDGRLASDGAPS